MKALPQKYSVVFSSAKCVLLLLKKNKITTVNVLLCFFRTFTPNFHFQLCSFCKRERKNISCPGAEYPSYATGIWCVENICFLENLAKGALNLFLGGLEWPWSGSTHDISFLITSEYQISFKNFPYILFANNNIE